MPKTFMVHLIIKSIGYSAFCQAGLSSCVILVLIALSSLMFMPCFNLTWTKTKPPKALCYELHNLPSSAWKCGKIFRLQL